MGKIYKKYIKIFQDDNYKNLQEQVNNFIRNNNVTATHDHVNVDNKGVFVYTVFCFHDVMEEE